MSRARAQGNDPKASLNDLSYFGQNPWNVPEVIANQILVDLEFQVQYFDESIENFIVYYLVKYLKNWPYTLNQSLNDSLDSTCEIYHRAREHRPMIDNLLSANEVPKVFGILPAVESAFDKSRINQETDAGGLWQFTPDTASLVDLRNPLDAVESTQKIVRLFKENYQLLRSWKYVLLAHNMPPSNLRTYAEQNYPFQEVLNEIPSETQCLYKRFVALTYVFYVIDQNPNKYCPA
ncbi:MAG: transglycosylase SLT domain-containing protein [Bdellovibrionales bacterium]|nr:transglycosylase SLT domain-containing protein [Bdellovibrionales bacterium]